MSSNPNSPEEQTGEKAVILEPQPHGGALLRSGGPGRPAVKKEAMDAIKRGLPKGIDALVKKAEEGNVKAIELLLHYGLGKPTDKVEMSGPDGGPVQLLQDFDDDTKRELKRLAVAELERRRAGSDSE